LQRSRQRDRSPLERPATDEADGAEVTNGDGEAVAPEVALSQPRTEQHLIAITWR